MPKSAAKPTYAEAYRHSVCTFVRQAAAGIPDLVNYLDTAWIARPHAKHDWQRGMAAGFVAAAYGVALAV